MGSFRRVHVCYGINCRRGINLLIFAAQIVAGDNLCHERKYYLSPATIYAGNIVCRGHHRRQYTQVLYAARKKSPAYIVAVALYFYLYFLFIAFFICMVNGSKGVLCYSYFYVNLCFKYKNKVIIE